MKGHKKFWGALFSIGLFFSIQWLYTSIYLEADEATRIIIKRMTVVFIIVVPTLIDMYKTMNESDIILPSVSSFVDGDTSDLLVFKELNILTKIFLIIIAVLNPIRWVYEICYILRIALIKFNKYLDKIL